MNDRYDDIIHLPHHISKTRPQMSMMDRAAQFSPFAALTGYDAAIKETGRLTDEKIELGEETKAVLDRKQSYLITAIGATKGHTGSFANLATLSAKSMGCL